jgi:hypothetical protein
MNPQNVAIGIKMCKFLEHKVKTSNSCSNEQDKQIIKLNGGPNGN